MNSGDRIRDPWSKAEDETLMRLVDQHGPCNWAAISAGISGRTGKSCRLRWINQLSPNTTASRSSTKSFPQSSCLSSSSTPKPPPLPASLNKHKSNNLKTSLSQTLKKFYPLATHVINNVHVYCSDAGVPYTDARSHCWMSDLISDPSPSEFIKFLPCEFGDVGDVVSSWLDGAELFPPREMARFNPRTGMWIVKGHFCPKNAQFADM